jgi:hypothetical protein
MEEAAAIIAVAIVNSNEELRADFANQSALGPTQGADFLRPYLTAARITLRKSVVDNLQ